jgi:PKHD-type hydroxylase
MLICIPDILSADEIREFRAVLGGASWVDGRETAGAQSAIAKDNLQLAEGSPEAKALGERVLAALSQSALFVSAALPAKIFPPLFSRYQPGHQFGIHVDNAVRAVKGALFRMRTDLSGTLFLSDPGDYDGGELVIEHGFGAQEIKLPAGHLVLYPSTSLHRVAPVTRGERLVSFLWLQSMVRDEGERAILFDLDQSIQALAGDLGLGHPEVVRLSGVYHNLVRRSADL